MSEHAHVSFSVKDKVNAVLRVLRGESHAAVAKELSVSAERVARWQSRFVQGGTAALAHHRRRRDSGVPAAAIWIAAIVLLAIVAFFIIRTVGWGSVGDAP